MNSIWDILWIGIKHSLENRKIPEDEDEYTRYNSLNALLYNISLICDEVVSNDIFKY